MFYATYSLSDFREQGIQVRVNEWLFIPGQGVARIIRLDWDARQVLCQVFEASMSDELQALKSSTNLEDFGVKVFD